MHVHSGKDKKKLIVYGVMIVALRMVGCGIPVEAVSRRTEKLLMYRNEGFIAWS